LVELATAIASGSENAPVGISPGNPPLPAALPSPGSVPLPLNWPIEAPVTLNRSTRLLPLSTT
jgi:hypothetical protein